MNSSQSTIRNKFEDIRLNLNKNIVSFNSMKIWKNLSSLLVFEQAQMIAFYSSKENSGEVETIKMICNSFSLKKNVFIPLINIGSNSLIFHKINNFDSDVKLGSYGIFEPESHTDILASSNDLDLIIIPGTVFDISGNRIGRGGGYYDKFLNSLSKSPIKIGLAHDFQIQPTIPIQSSDVKMDFIITEKRIISFNN
jgi:5-formyltetrahydrofolate cyclo-ligase